MVESLLPIAVPFQVWEGMIDGYQAKRAGVLLIGVCTPFVATRVIVGRTGLSAGSGWAIELGWGLVLSPASRRPGSGGGRVAGMKGPGATPEHVEN